MSLYNKTKYEIAQYFEDNFLITEEIKKKIIKESIDGEVLFEMNDKDFKALNFNTLDIQNINHKIKEEKKTLKEQTEEELIQKLMSLGIEDPIEFIFSNNYKDNLSIGESILLQKLNQKLSNTINEITYKTQIFDFLENF